MVSKKMGRPKNDGKYAGIKTRTYTFALTVEDTKNIGEVIRLVEKFPKYAYILHDKDLKNDGTPKKNHYHFFVDFPSARSLLALAKDLGIKPNFIERVYDKKGILAYFTHSKQPEKYRYEDSDIITNFDIENELKDDGFDVLTMFQDYKKFRMGLLSSKEFLTRYIVRH